MPTTPPPIALKLTVLGTRFDAGTRITVRLTAPPNGRAFALVCGFPDYQLLAGRGSTEYLGTVLTPQTIEPLNCPVSAEFFDSGGRTAFATSQWPVTILPLGYSQPLFQIAPYYDNDEADRRRHEHRAQPTPSPTPAPPTRILPGPVTTAPPTTVPKPIYTRYPKPVRTEPQPVRTAPPVRRHPVEREVSSPHPKATSRPDAG
ncbi:MAG TPA: hypothetical protein VNF68_09750 [Candidatus Baltobacteraceae bacterium]|nr:hypothetical protein [Candidatus Baltobacteraceae bacterium]